MTKPALSVNLRQARAQLSQLADAAHAGHTIVLTRYGKPWARLMPTAHPQQPEPSCGRFLLNALGSDPAILLRNGHDPGLKTRLLQWRRSAVPTPGRGTETSERRRRGILLDTTLLLWWWGFPFLLPEPWCRWLKAPDLPVHVSMASLQQLHAAAHDGRLAWLKEPLHHCRTLMEADGFQVMPVELRHLQAAARDPGADLTTAMLRAQAHLEALELLQPGAAMTAASGGNLPDQGSQGIEHEGSLAPQRMGQAQGWG